MFIRDPKVSWGERSCTLRGVEYYDLTPYTATWRYSAVDSLSLPDGYPLNVRVGGAHFEVIFMAGNELDGCKLREFAAELARRMELP